MKTSRTHVQDRLAEINAAAKTPEPPMHYWTTLRHAAERAQRAARAQGLESSAVD